MFFSWISYTELTLKKQKKCYTPSLPSSLNLPLKKSQDLF